MCNKKYLPNFIKKAISAIEKYGGDDIGITPVELAEITDCLNCGAPVFIDKILIQSPINSSVCSYCGKPILKEFVFYFPEADNSAYCSVTLNSKLLVEREDKR